MSLTILSNLLEIASNKEEANEGNDEDEEYHYYLLKKAPYSIMKYIN